MSAFPAMAASSGSGLIDLQGNPLKPTSKTSVAHQAADRFSQELAAWHPFLGSADADWLPERDTVAARIHDLANNDGWISSGVQKQVDNVIGAMFMPQAQPDWEALGQDSEWAMEWAGAVERKWRDYAEHPNFWCDATRKTSMVGLFGLMYRHWVVDGEATGVLRWLPNRGAPFATALRVIDPDRLSNPNDRPDEEFLRAGIELGSEGEPLAAHVRRSHPGDFLGLGVNRFEWERVPFETAFGRRVFIHHFEQQRADQTRGKSILTPAVKTAKQTSRWSDHEMGAALLNSILAASLQSPFDPETVSQALQTDGLGEYQEARSNYHSDSRLRLGGVRIPVLYPGEELKWHTATRPSNGYAPFLTAALRNIAAAMGLSYEQLAMDWSQTNYSSARAALLEVWKGFTTRRGFFGESVARQVYAAWLEEAIDQRVVEIPPGAPDFLEAKAAYTRCRWTGPGRGWVDPVREAQGAVLRIEGGFSTLQRECAEQGLDWEEVLDQRAREIAKMDALKIPRLEWAQAEAAAPSDTPERTQQSGD